jgi:hypothetical protein
MMMYDWVFGKQRTQSQNLQETAASELEVYTQNPGLSIIIQTSLQIDTSTALVEGLFNKYPD